MCLLGLSPKSLRTSFECPCTVSAKFKAWGPSGWPKFPKPCTQIVYLHPAPSVTFSCPHRFGWYALMSTSRRCQIRVERSFGDELGIKSSKVRLSWFKLCFVFWHKVAVDHPRQVICRGRKQILFLCRLPQCIRLQSATPRLVASNFHYLEFTCNGKRTSAMTNFLVC